MGAKAACFAVGLRGRGRPRLLAGTLAALVAVAVGWACWNAPHWCWCVWCHTRIRAAGGTVWVASGVEGHGRPAIVDDPADVRYLSLNSGAFGDGQVSLLRAYTRLIRLSLSGTKIRSAAIKCINSPSLFVFEARGTGVDDDGVRLLAERFPRLCKLDLGDTPLTDGCAKWLCHLTAPCDVYLDGTGVSDTGLRDFDRGPQGLTLFLVGTKVTKGGINALARTRPDIRCFWGANWSVARWGPNVPGWENDKKARNDRGGNPPE